MSAATFCFSVHADAEPSALPRVMAVFTLHGHVPTRCRVERGGPRGEELVIDAQLDGLVAADAEQVAKRLGRVVSVAQVLWSEKRRCTTV